MEQFAGGNEFSSVVAALFSVLLLFLLLVLFHGFFFRVVQRVDFVHILFRHFFHARFRARFGNQLREFIVGIVHGGKQPEIFRSRLQRNIRYRREINGVVRDDFVADFAVLGVVHKHKYFVHARVLNFARLRFGNLLARVRHNFARFGVHDVVRDDLPRQTIGKVQLFIVLVSAHLGYVIAAGIEEQIIKVRTHGIFRRHFAGAQTAIQFDQTVRFRFGGIFRHRFANHLVAGEQLFDRVIAPETERAEKHRNAKFLLSVHTHIQGILSVLFQFQPGALVRHHRGGKHFLTGFIFGGSVVNAGRTHQLRNDNSFRAVDDERAVLRHLGQIAHEHFLVNHFVFHLVHKAHFHAERQRIGSVAVAALFLVVLGLIAEAVVEEVQFEVVGIVGNRGEILKYFADALFDKRSVAFLLNFHKFGNIDHFVDLAEFASFVLTVFANR